MIHRLYVILDLKSRLYGMPFNQHNDAVAYRTAQSLVMDKESDFGKHPADFQMQFWGTFDNETALFTKAENLEGEYFNINLNAIGDAKRNAA